MTSWTRWPPTRRPLGPTPSSPRKGWFCARNGHSAGLTTPALNAFGSRGLRSAAFDAAPDHLPWVDDLVKAPFIDVARRKRCLPQGQVLVSRLAGNGRGLVVADYRSERRHQHQRTADHFVDAWAVKPGTLDREMPQLLAGVAKDPGRVKEIVDDDWAPRVELEIPLAAGKGDDIVLADHLGADHDHRLLLGRVDLARHDRGARLVFRQ